ncbi:GIY-YIG nuclease family protein [Rossellomorea sp. DUT-2]|uniref:GIY-YIG nuclease family protein n=1 Tax=Rossellomorea sp. DUT-2 TaxID=3412021 RepID=UPI003D1755F0
MDDIKEEIFEHSRNIYNTIADLLLTVDMEEVITSNGYFKDAHETTKKGSFIYLLYDSHDRLLYVGETGTSIKKRLISDGSGAHRSTNPELYKQIKYIKYFKSSEDNLLNSMERKMIEQATTIYLKPKYYSKKIWSY